MDDGARPIVDFEVVRAQTLDDEAFERRLLAAFLDDNEARVQAAREALEGSDSDALTLEAHSLKGAASTLGAAPLADAARALEQTAAAGRFTEARDALATVERELARVREVLFARLAEPTDDA